MPTTTDIAWAAGFFEGEGWITVTDKTRLYGVNNCDLEPMEKLRSILGGRLYGPYGRNGHPERRPYYIWRPRHRREQQAVLRLLYPWLSSRRRAQADKFLALWPTRGRPPALMCGRGHPRTGRECYECRRLTRPLRPSGKRW